MELRIAEPGAPLRTLCARYTNQHNLACGTLEERVFFAQLLSSLHSCGLLGTTQSLNLPADLTLLFRLLGNSISVPRAAVRPCGQPYLSPGAPAGGCRLCACLLWDGAGRPTGSRYLRQPPCLDRFQDIPGSRVGVASLAVMLQAGLKCSGLRLSLSTTKPRRTKRQRQRHAWKPSAAHQCPSA